MTTRILIADDQPDIREALRLLLKGEGYAVDCAGTPAAAVASAEHAFPDLVLMDMNYARDTTSGEEGLELLQRLRSLDPHLPVVVMTAWGSVELAVEAMRLGAKDFVQKPWDNARLLATLGTQLDLAKALKANQRLAEENRILRGGDLPGLVAQSRAMRVVQDLVQRVGPSDATVLITGENGTGKGLVASHLHALSRRASQPLITLNAGGLSEGVLESELFGHVKGAYSDALGVREGRFDVADGGTLFLDEIGNAPLSLQAKLLRVLETGEFERVGSSRTRKVDVRLLSATNADLEAEAAAGRFRQDLRFRLNTIEIHVPPLRDRTEDLPVLASLFLERHARKYRKDILGLDEEAMRALRGHPWPGNVRELDHALERAVLLCQGSRIQAPDLMLSRGPAAAGAEEMGLEEMETALICKALARCGSATAAAETLGLSRSALYRRLQKLGIRA